MCGNMKQRMGQRTSGPGMPGRGFTLMEVIIVVILIGIASAIAVPMVSNVGSMQVRAAANRVAADLEYAKSMAISRGQHYSVVFSATAASYEIVDKNGNPIPHPITKQPRYLVGFRDDCRLNRVGIGSATFDGTNKVMFDYLGIPYNGGGTGLANVGVITLQAGGVTKTVRVEPVTGFISISN